MDVLPVAGFGLESEGDVFGVGGGDFLECGAGFKSLTRCDRSICLETHFPVQSKSRM